MSATAHQIRAGFDPRTRALSTGPVAPSSGKGFGQGIEADGFKAWFLPRWATWLQANFRNPEAVAVAFDVRMRTACNWWNADNCPTGEVVALAFLRFPDAIHWLLAEWHGEGALG